MLKIITHFPTGDKGGRGQSQGEPHCPHVEIYSNEIGSRGALSATVSAKDTLSITDPFCLTLQEKPRHERNIPSTKRCLQGQLQSLSHEIPISIASESKYHLG
jgi:hypothetical protein